MFHCLCNLRCVLQSYTVNRHFNIRSKVNSKQKSVGYNKSMKLQRLRCLQREACFRIAACFSILLRHECVLRHDTLQCCSAIYGGQFGCSGLLIWRLVSSIVDTWCFAMLRCLALRWQVLAGMPCVRGSAIVCIRPWRYALLTNVHKTSV